MSLSNFHHPFDRVSRPQFEHEVRRAILRSISGGVSLPDPGTQQDRAQEAIRPRGMSPADRNNLDGEI